jgi:hypothetical protein
MVATILVRLNDDASMIILFHSPGYSKFLLVGNGNARIGRGGIITAGRRLVTRALNRDIAGGTGAGGDGAAARVVRGRVGAGVGDVDIAWTRGSGRRGGGGRGAGGRRGRGSGDGGHLVAVVDGNEGGGVGQDLEGHLRVGGAQVGRARRGEWDGRHGQAEGADGEADAQPAASPMGSTAGWVVGPEYVHLRILWVMFSMLGHAGS